MPLESGTSSRCTGSSVEERLERALDLVGRLGLELHDDAAVLERVHDVLLLGGLGVRAVLGRDDVVRARVGRAGVVVHRALHVLAVALGARAGEGAARGLDGGLEVGLLRRAGTVAVGQAAGFGGRGAVIAAAEREGRRPAGRGERHDARHDVDDEPPPPLARRLGALAFEALGPQGLLLLAPIRHVSRVVVLRLRQERSRRPPRPVRVAPGLTTRERH